MKKNVLPENCRYIDIGVNLFSSQFEGRENGIVEKATEAGVGMIITGSSLRSSSMAAEYVTAHNEGLWARGAQESHLPRERALQGFEEHPREDNAPEQLNAAFPVFSTAGVHPHDAKSCDDRTIDALRKILTEHDSVIAVGECGLDYDRMFSPADIQRFWFERQVELAEELGLPLFLHERAASGDFREILARHRGVCERAVVHCFTGTRQEAEQYLELGCMIGITGWICDERRNADLLEAMKSIPAERLMAETDAPYLKPRGIRGLKGSNVPENIRYVAERIAAEKQMETETMRQILLDNTRRFFEI